MQVQIEFWQADVLEAKDSFHVVKGHKYAIHAAHSDLQRILQESRSDHIKELALIRLPTTKPLLNLVAKPVLMSRGVHSYRDHGSRLQAEQTYTRKTGVASI